MRVLQVPEVQRLYFEEIDEGVQAVMEVHIDTSDGATAAAGGYIKVQCPGLKNEYQFIFNNGPAAAGKVRGPEGLALDGPLCVFVGEGRAWGKGIPTARALCIRRRGDWQGALIPVARALWCVGLLLMRRLLLT